jgi:hypothetical protein
MSGQLQLQEEAWLIPESKIITDIDKILYLMLYSKIIFKKL